MNWPDLVAEIGLEAAASFGRAVTHTPTIKTPNGRPEPDPARPAYPTVAIYDPDKGGGRGYQKELSVGRQVVNEQVAVPTTRPTIFLNQCDAVHPPSQGDEFTLEDTGERFRVLSVHAASPGTWRLPVEVIGRPSLK